ncbi:MAG: hypothetical protein LBS75_06590 [Synergistaceae bacterium]|nr:hypothetical protein [Synergistaceae bacterium]
MRHGRKIAAALAAAVLIAMASSAAASGRTHHRRYGGEWWDGGGWVPGMMRGHISGGGRPGWRPGGEVPRSIRDKMTASEKLSIDLRDLTSRTVIDRGKVLETFRKRRELRNEIAEWFFTQRLDWLIANPGGQLRPDPRQDGQNP